MRRTAKRIRLVVVGAVGLGLLAGCSDYFLGPVGTPLEQTLGDASSPVTVDFDRLYPGSWDRLLLVCDGSTSDEIEDALGYPWPQVADVAEGGFLLAGDTVVGAYGSGDTTASREPWVYPCPLPGERDGVDVRVVVLPRGAAQVTFVPTVKYGQTDHPRTVWSIVPEEYRALAECDASLKGGAC